eukprot:CAMPEP_0114497768 /NCGR_PEP_ID=MMETSP0109-20121206/6509_1 /TAXON_ID=29199 /ORGANISM="Chlorarachnion reptans, Strain CCCM449" /LENGTH=801 /DNA_ID=CAMNT_0001675189 /DNA_START=58 /DNA_END=2463 /DNA_ORIENTATION=+
MDSPPSVQSTKSRMRRSRKDAQLRKALMSDYGSVKSAGAVLTDVKTGGRPFSASSQKPDIPKPSMSPRNSIIRMRQRPSLLKKPSVRSAKSDTIKRTVMGLRPGKAMTIPCTISVQEAARKMGSVRADAALVTLNGEVCGIITDSDITRRVVAEGKKASSTPVSLVMTGSPLNMKPTDPAYDALHTMVEKHFRHMPVMRSKSSIVGLLDINRCLSDAIKRNEGSDALKSGALSGLAFTLEQVINKNSEEAPFVFDKDPVIDAAKLMKKTRKTAVLVKDFKRTVVGILTTKDIMLRVVAARLMPHSTTVARVMTPHPDTVPSAWTVGQALKQMRSKRYLHLPVRADDTGDDVIGLVDALELCYSVLKPEKVGKENEGDEEDGLRGVLEGLWQGGDASYASDSESVGTGSIMEDRLATPQRSRTSTVAGGASATPSLIRRGSTRELREKLGADDERRSVRSEGKKIDAAAPTAALLSQVESCISGAEKNIEEATKNALGGFEGTLAKSLSEQTKELQANIQKEVGEVRSLIKEAKWSASSDETKIQMLQANGVLAKLEALPSVVESKMNSTFKSLLEQMEKLEQTVRKQDTQQATQMEVIRNLSKMSSGAGGASNTAAGPMTIQPLLEILSKHRSALQEHTSVVRQEVSGSMHKIERMVSDTNTTLTKLASTTAAMPDMIKTAVARASRPSFGGAPTSTSRDSKAEVTDTCNRIAFQTVEIVRSKVSSAFDNARQTTTEVTKASARLAGSVEKMKEIILSKLDADIDSRVQAKVENELLKVAGAAALAGALLGMLSIKLFGPK